MAARAGSAKTKAGQTSAGPPLFNGLRYFIASCIPIKDHAGLKTTLTGNGAIEVKSVAEAEYIFTDSESFEGANEVQPRTALVLPVWIDRSIMNKTRQDPRYFSPSPRAIFSTLVVATDHLPPGDVDTVIAGIQAKGGMYRDGLTRDVTHLLVLAPTGDKYRTARRYAAQTGIKIVLAHWFDDCFKTEHRLPEGPYEAALLQAEQENKEGGPKSDVPVKRKKLKLPERTKAFYDALKMAGTPPLTEGNAGSQNASNAIKPNTDVWRGRRILLSHSLMLSKDRRDTVIMEIERFGGSVISTSTKKAKAQGERVGSSVSEDEAALEGDELDSDDGADLEEDIQFEFEFAKKDPVRGTANDIQVSARYRAADLREAMLVMEDKVDVLVTKYRSGLAYLAALHRFGDRGKEVVVATLPWVFYVQYTGAFTAPINQLLHFPVRRGAVHDIRGKAITVSNYQGPARDYIKKLIGVMAGPRGPGVPDVFTATLSRQTNIVIASRLEGQKVESAQSWKIPIVNHLWLEDTFKAWRGANLAEPRYTHWRSKISYGDLLPGCAVVDEGPAELKEGATEVMNEMEAIGYDEEIISAAWTGSLEMLRNAQEAPRQSVVPPDHAMLSYEEVERDLQVKAGQMDVDEDVDQTIIPETSSQRNPARTLDKPLSKAGAVRGFDPPSGRGLVPVFTRMRRGSAPGERAVNATVGPSIHDAKPSSSSQKAPSSNKQSANEAKSRNGSQLPKTAAVPAAPAGPTLRSPWDPSPKKKYNLGVVTNDSPIEFRRPTKKKPETANSRTARRQAMDPFSSVDYEDVDMEDVEPQHRKERKSASKSIAKQLDSSNESSLEEEAPSNLRQGSKAKRAQQDPPSAGRGNKRNIQTQESDEEFRVETQDDLISRRRKVIDAEHMDVSGSDEEPKRGAKGQKKVSGKASTAIKRLRESISGKEGVGNTKESGKKAVKGRRVSLPPDPEESQSDEPQAVEVTPKVSARGANKPQKAAKPVETSSLTPSPSDEEKNPSSPPTSALTRLPTLPSSEDEQEVMAPRARRGAATKATQLLRDKIMPDANRFAQQMKTGDIRGEWEDNKKRRRGDSVMEDTDDTAEKKRRKGGEGIVAGTSKKKREQPRQAPATAIRMLTTKVPLKDEELDKLHQMGIQTVTDPLLCTHLVSNAILRTEKFICAISVSPIIVTEKWIRECLRAKRVVDTAPYILEDDEGEARFNFELQACLEQAQHTGKTLLKGHTFFLIFTAENADLVIRTLSSAIKSAGGSVVRQVPSPRQMEGHEHDRHVISDMKEQAKWLPLSQKGYPIYNQETILIAILRQELPDWNEPSLLLS